MGAACHKCFVKYYIPCIVLRDVKKGVSVSLKDHMILFHSATLR